MSLRSLRSLLSATSAPSVSVAALLLLILLQDEGCFCRELGPHSRPPITINAMNCPCVQRDECPRVYGESAVDIRELGFLEPCTEFGTVRCCGVAIRIEQTMGGNGGYGSEKIEFGKPVEGRMEGNLYLTEVDGNTEDLKVEGSSVNNLRASVPLQMDRSSKSMMGNRLRFNAPGRQMEKVEEGNEPRPNPSPDVRVDLRTLEGSENPTDTIIIEAIPISPGQDSSPLPKTGTDRKKELKGRILSGGPQRTKRPFIASNNLNPSSKYVSSASPPQPPPLSKLNLTSKPPPPRQPPKKISPTEKVAPTSETNSTTPRPRRLHKLSPVSALPKIRPFNYNKRPLHPPPPSHSSSEQMGLSPVQVKLSKPRELINEQSKAGSDVPRISPSSTDAETEGLVEEDVTSDEKPLLTPPPPPPVRNQRRRPQRLRGPGPINNPAPETPPRESAAPAESETSNLDPSAAPSKSPPAFPPRRRTGPRIRPFNPTSAPVAPHPEGTVVGEDGSMETAETVAFPNRAGGMHKMTRTQPRQTSTASPLPALSSPPSVPAGPGPLPEAVSSLQSNISVEEIRGMDENMNANAGESKEKSSDTQPSLPVSNPSETQLPQKVIPGNEEKDVNQYLHLTENSASSSGSPLVHQEEPLQASHQLHARPHPANPLPKIRQNKLRRKQQEQTYVAVKEPKTKPRESVKTTSQYSRIRLTTQEISDPKDNGMRVAFGPRPPQTGGSTRFSIPADLFPARKPGSYGHLENGDGQKEGGSGQGERTEGSGVINFERGSDYHLVLDKEKRKNLELSPRPNTGTPSEAGLSPPTFPPPPANRFRGQATLSTSNAGITYQNFTKSVDDMHPGESAQESRIHPTSIQITRNDMKHAQGEPPAAQSSHAYASNVNQLPTQQTYNNQEKAEKAESGADHSGNGERNRKKIKYRVRVPVSTTTTPSTPTPPPPTRPSNTYHETGTDKSTLLPLRPGSVSYNPFDSYTGSDLSNQAPQPPPSQASDLYASPPTDSQAQLPALPPPPAPPATNYPPPLIRIQSVPDNRPYISSRPPPTTTQASTFVFPPYRPTEKTTTTEGPSSLFFGAYESEDKPSASSTLPPTRIKISPPPSPSLFEEEEKSKIGSPNHPERVPLDIASSGDKYGSGNKNLPSQQQNPFRSQSQGSPKGVETEEEGKRGSYDSKLYGGHKQSSVPPTNAVKLSESQSWRGMEPTPRPSQGSWSLNMPQNHHQINAPKPQDTRIPVNDTRSAPAPRPPHHGPSSYQHPQYSSPPTSAPTGIRQAVNQEAIKYQGGRQPPRTPTYNSSPAVSKVNRTRFSVPQVFHFPGGESSGESYKKPQQHGVATSNNRNRSPAPPQREDDTIRNTQFAHSPRHPNPAPPRPQPPNYYQQGQQKEKVEEERVPPQNYRHQYPPTSIRFSSIEQHALPPPQNGFPGHGTSWKALPEKVEHSAGNPPRETHMNSKDAHPTPEERPVNPSAGEQQPLDVQQALSPVAPPQYQPQIHNLQYPHHPPSAPSAPPLPSQPPPMHQPAPLTPQHQSPYTAVTQQLIGAAAASHSPSVHLPPDQQLGHSFQPAHFGPFSRPEQPTNDIPFLPSPHISSSSINNEFHGNYQTRTPEGGVTISFSSLASQPPATRHNGFHEETLSPTRNEPTNAQNHPAETEREQESFTKQSTMHISSSERFKQPEQTFSSSADQHQAEAGNLKTLDQDQSSFGANFHQAFQPQPATYRQQQPHHTYQRHHQQQSIPQFQRQPPASLGSSGNNRDLHSSPQFPINSHQAPSNYNTPDGGNPWSLSSSPPAASSQSSPGSTRDGASPLNYLGFNRESSATFTGPYGSSSSNSMQSASGSSDPRLVRHGGATPAYALPPSSYPFQYSGTHLSRDGSQQTGRVSLPQAIVTQLGSSIRNSRATNFSDALPGRKVGGEADEAWLEKAEGLGKRGENPGLTQFLQSLQKIHSIPLDGREETDKGKLMEMTTPFSGIPPPQTAHESQLTKFEKEDQRGSGTEGLSSISPNRLPQWNLNLPTGPQTAIEEKVLYEFHPKFKAPEDLQRGFRPILPYSDADPGPLLMNMAQNESPADGLSPLSTQFYAYTTAA